nr:MAG TPA: hypothetical protein [Caudoviricetes sp.]
MSLLNQTISTAHLRLREQENIRETKSPCKCVGSTKRKDFKSTKCIKINYLHYTMLTAEMQVQRGRKPHFKRVSVPRLRACMGY